MVVWLLLTAVVIGFVSSLQVEEWNIDKLEIHDWEADFPSPFPTPFEAHPRNTHAPSFSVKPTSDPTQAPTETPTLFPTFEPSLYPTITPSVAPSIGHPTNLPTFAPSPIPTLSPSFKPSPYPTLFPSLPGHIGSQSPTPGPTYPHESLELEYILFGAIVTLGDMMIIAATIWSAIILMAVAFLQRRKIFGNKPSHVVDESDSSIHSDISEHSTAAPSGRLGTEFGLTPSINLKSTPPPITPLYSGLNEKNKILSTPAPTAYASQSARAAPPAIQHLSLPLQPTLLPDEEEENLSLRL